MSYGGTDIRRYYRLDRTFDSCKLNNVIFLPFEYSNPYTLRLDNCNISNTTVYIKNSRTNTTSDYSPELNYNYGYHFTFFNDCILTNIIIKIDTETVDDDFINGWWDDVKNNNECTNIKVYSLNDDNLLFEI